VGVDLLALLRLPLLKWRQGNATKSTSRPRLPSDSCACRRTLAVSARCQKREARIKFKVMLWILTPLTRAESLSLCVNRRSIVFGAKVLSSAFPRNHQIGLPPVTWKSCIFLLYYTQQDQRRLPAIAFLAIVEPSDARHIFLDRRLCPPFLDLLLCRAYDMMSTMSLQVDPAQLISNLHQHQRLEADAKPSDAFKLERDLQASQYFKMFVECSSASPLLCHPRHPPVGILIGWSD